MNVPSSIFNTDGHPHLWTILVRGSMNPSSLELSPQQLSSSIFRPSGSSMQDSDMMRIYVRTYRLLVTLVYHIARAPGPGRPRRLYRVNRNSTAHGMLIASDQTMCALPQDQYQANFTQVWLNVSLVPIEGFHCHLRMRVIDDDSVYVPWSLLT